MLVYGHEELSDLSTANLLCVFSKINTIATDESWLLIGIFLWNLGLIEGGHATFLMLPLPIVLPNICSYVPIKGGGGSHIPKEGAPVPPWDALGMLLVLLQNLGASLPVIFLTSSIANGIPIDAKIVPNPLPCCVLVRFIWTPEPISRALRISSFYFVERRCLYAINWLILLCGIKKPPTF